MLALDIEDCKEQIMTETHENRIKRLRLRSWRRGTKEMDLILGGFADQELETLSADELDAHERLMAEHDQDLYQWISGQAEIPSELTEPIERLRGFVNQKR